MDNQISDSLMEKIRALLRMAEHPNSNQFEKELAMERAQKLLQAHNLSRATVMDDGSVKSDESIGMIDLQEGKSVYKWKSRLLGAIALANMCRIVYSDYSQTTHLFGTPTNCRVVLELYYWLGEQLTEIGVRDFKAYKADYGTQARTSWLNSFYLGAILSLTERLRKPVDEFRAGTGKELMLFNDQAIKAAQHKVFPRLSSARAWTANGDGYAAGRAAGASVSFSRPGRLGNPNALGSGR